MAIGQERSDTLVLDYDIRDHLFKEDESIDWAMRNLGV